MDLKRILRKIIGRLESIMDLSLLILEVSLTASQGACVLGTLCVIKLLIFGFCFLCSYHWLSDWLIGWLIYNFTSMGIRHSRSFILEGTDLKLTTQLQHAHTHTKQTKYNATYKLYTYNMQHNKLLSTTQHTKCNIHHNK